MDNGLVANAATGDLNALDELIESTGDNLWQVSRALELAVDASNHELRRKLIGLLYDRGSAAVLSTESSPAAERSLAKFTELPPWAAATFVWPLTCEALWPKGAGALFECDAAEHVLDLYVLAFPGEQRLHDGIEMKRAWTRGELTDEKKALEISQAAFEAYTEACQAADGESASTEIEAAAWAAKAAWDVVESTGAIVDPIEAAREARSLTMGQANLGYAQERRWQEDRMLATLIGRS